MNNASVLRHPSQQALTLTHTTRGTCTSTDTACEPFNVNNDYMCIYDYKAINPKFLNQKK